jgi:hypothetical protein
MSIPQTVAEVIGEHVSPEVEGVDRMYLNVYETRNCNSRSVLNSIGSISASLMISISSWMPSASRPPETNVVTRTKSSLRCA